MLNWTGNGYELPRLLLPENPDGRVPCIPRDPSTFSCTVIGDYLLRRQEGRVVPNLRFGTWIPRV